MNKENVTCAEVKTCQVVASPILARKLLQMGYPVIDIKRDRRSDIKSVFVFKNTKKLQRDYDKLLREFYGKDYHGSTEVCQKEKNK